MPGDLVHDRHRVRRRRRGIRLSDPPPSRLAARAYWQEHRPRLARPPRPRRPSLVLLSGVPLVGKTTLARCLVDRLDAETLHVENDRLRQLVVEAMDREEPRFDGDESYATYEAARGLVDRGLREGLHVVHDATNLAATDRRETCAIADDRGAPCLVVFVDAPHAELEQRARREGPAAEQALAALGDRDPSPGQAERPYLVLDGTREPEANVQTLLETRAFRSLRRTLDP